MGLIDLDLAIGTGQPPAEVRAFLREAERRVARFQADRIIPGFVASDYAGAYRVLRALAEARAVPGQLFCEWGCGFGVVACLAAMLDFDACGIEIESELVEEARRLADDFDLPVEFVHGSFIPRRSEACFQACEEFAWLTAEPDSAQDELGLAPADFGVIFAYPWPDEERLVAALFERHVAPGAVLVTYHGNEKLRLRRKRA